MRFAAPWPALFCALLFPAAHAQTPVTAQSIQARLHAPFLMLRGMYGGRSLHFDQHGRLRDLAGVVPFSLSALQLRSVRFDGRSLDILATRAGLEFHPSQSPAQSITVTAVPLSPPPAPGPAADHSPSTHPSRSQRDSAPPPSDQVNIFIRLNRRHPARIDKALARIFSRGIDTRLAAVAPQPWQPWLQRYLHPSNRRAARHVQSCRAPGLTPPRLLRSQDPAFTSAARRAHYQGTVVLGLTIDTSGQPQHIVIVRPLGMGLDESAVEAARRFLYSPALRNGDPETCRADVDFTFQLNGS